MNQESTNFNVNNFNTQGNNGIPNNQPLNNQSFNPTFNQNVVSNSSDNQPIFNPQSMVEPIQQPVQPQQAHSYEQPLTQEPTPQPVNNTFESGNANNQDFNSKPPKKMNLGLIIGIVAAVAVVVVGIVFGSKLLSNGGSNNNNNSTDVVDNIKKGTAKLVYTTKNKIHQIEDINAYNYFETKDENGKTIILDNKGNIALTVNGYYKYLGDNYFLYSDNELKVFDVNKKKVVYTFEDLPLGNDNLAVEYNNGTLYYNAYEENYVFIAYDLVNGKELWRIDTANSIVDNAIIDRIGLDGEYIYLRSNNYDSVNVKEIYPSVVVDLKGNVIVEGNTDKYEYYNFEKDDLIHTYVMNNYYLKVQFKKYIEVYDFNHKLISNISLEHDGSRNYQLDKVFNDGLFTVWEYDENFLGKYVLYDVNKNIVLESDSRIDYASNINGSIISSNVLALESRNKYYLIKDSKIVEKFDDYRNEDFSVIVTPLAGDENSYLLLENNDTVNSIYTKQYINLKTLAKFDVPLENVTENFEESPNGDYIRLSTGNDFYIYDSKFNLKYESTNLLKPINDKYVFEYTLDGNKISIVNIENGEKNEVEIKGKFQTELSSGGFVTFDGTNYYLYAFN